jgi:uncharacterized RDD family membrane protein YckC
MPQGSPAVTDGAQYRVAGLFRRVAATLVDLLLLVPLVLLFGGASALVTGQTLPRPGELGLGYLVHLAVDGGVAGAVALGIGALVGLLYVVIFLATSGQTPGLRLLGLRVIDGYGESPSLLRAIVRTLGLGVSLAAFGLGVLWIGFSREKQGLHDLVAGTWVVRAGARLEAGRAGGGALGMQVQ